MTRRSSLVVLSLALFVSYAISQQTTSCRQQPQQTVCECTKLDECLKNQRDQTNQFENDCGQACSLHLGPNSTAILDCLSAYETEKINHRLFMDKCMNDLAGRPCTGGNESEKTFVFNSTLIAQSMAADQSIVKQKMALIKNNPQMNLYKKCFKTCVNRLRLVSTPTATGKNTKQPNCYVQLGCQIDNDPAKKSVRKLAKANCSMQSKIDKASLKSKLSECLQSASIASSAETASSPACQKQQQHSSNEL